MIDVTDTVLDRIAEVYIVSNTPIYLFNKLRADENIHRISKKYSTEKLINTIIEVDRSEERSPHSVALAYASAVALTYKYSCKILSLLNNIEIYNLNWIKSIFQYWEEIYIPHEGIIIGHLSNVMIEKEEIEDDAPSNTRTASILGANRIDSSINEDFASNNETIIRGTEDA